MAHFDSPAPASTETETTAMAERNARYGLVLFFLYLALYAGFMGLSAFGQDWLRQDLLGVNLAIHYGMALIFLAFLLALVYGWLCRK